MQSDELTRRCSEYVARQRAQLAEATRLRDQLAAGADTGAGSAILAHRFQRASVREIVSNGARAYDGPIW